MSSHATFAVHHLAVNAAPCCRDDLIACLAGVASIIPRTCLAWVGYITLRAVMCLHPSNHVFHFVHLDVVWQSCDAIRWNRCLFPAGWTTQITRPPAVVVYTLKAFLAERVMATKHLRDCERFHTYRTLE